MGQMYFPDEFTSHSHEKKGKNHVTYLGNSVEPSNEVVDFSYVRNSVKSWDSMRICAMSDNGMCAAIYKSNGYSLQCNACYDGIEYVRGKQETIIDLNVTKSGSSIIIYGRNGYYPHCCPSNFIDSLSNCNKNSEEILSATINEHGDYCIVTNGHVYFTNSLASFIDRAKSRFVSFRYAFISELGKIAICEKGIYYENIPTNLEHALMKISFIPDYIKFTDSGYYSISNKTGAAIYYLGLLLMR